MRVRDPPTGVDGQRLARAEKLLGVKSEVIELRTDPKYGGFLKHDPARAKVKVAASANTRIALVAGLGVMKVTIT